MGTFKEQKISTAKAKTDLTISTINGGNVITSQLEPNAVYFENALEQTTFGKFNYFLIFVSALIFQNTYIESTSISYVLPVSQCDLNLSTEKKGLLGAIGVVGVISSSLLWGFLADTKGRRKVLRSTLLLGFLSTLLSSFAINFWMLVIMRFLNGFFISCGSATTFAYLGEFHTNKNRARAIMASSFIFGTLGLLMPAITRMIINQGWQFFIPILGITYKPWRLYILVCGLLGLISGLCLYKIPESPNFLLVQGNERRCLQILQKIFHINTGKPISYYPVTHVIEDFDCVLSSQKLDKQPTNQVIAFFHSIWNQIQPLFNKKYLLTTILICSIQFGISISNGFNVWFPDIFNNFAEFIKDNPGNRTSICQAIYEKYQQNIFEPAVNKKVIDTSTEPMIEQCNEKLESTTYEYSFVLEVLYAVGLALIAVIINRVGKISIMFVCLVVCGLCGIATVYVNIPIVAICLFLTLMLFGLGSSVLYTASIDLYPTVLRAMAVCIPQMMGCLGSVVGTTVIAAVINKNCETAFIASGSTLIVCGFSVLFISKPKVLKAALDVEQNFEGSNEGNQARN